MIKCEDCHWLNETFNEFRAAQEEKYLELKNVTNGILQALGMKIDVHPQGVTYQINPPKQKGHGALPSILHLVEALNKKLDGPPILAPDGRRIISTN